MLLSHVGVERTLTAFRQSIGHFGHHYMTKLLLHSIVCCPYVLYGGKLWRHKNLARLTIDQVFTIQIFAHL